MVACFASNSLWVLECGVDLCCVSWGCVEDGGVGILPAGSPSYTPMRVVCRQGLVEIKTQWCEEHKDLDRFRPPERNTLRVVWWFVLP